MLSAAAQRDDRSLTAPEKLKGGAADMRAAGGLGVGRWSRQARISRKSAVIAITKPATAVTTKTMSWNQPDCGNIDMRIAADGTWLYCGSPLGLQTPVSRFRGLPRNATAPTR
jgi:hypothetical protein